MNAPEPLPARTDVLVSRILDAVGTGDTAGAVVHARQLATIRPEAAVWSTWVVAGCRALDGNLAGAYRLLVQLAATGGWLGEPLLADSSLRPLWSGPAGPRLRAALAAPAAEVAGTTVVVPVLSCPAPRAVILTVHGNGPLPPAALRELWDPVPDVHVVALRSGVAHAPEVPVWTDRVAARTQLRAAIADVRRSGPRAPLVVLGLGSGATIALETCADGTVDADQVVAVAPRKPRSDAPAPGAPSMRAVLDSTATSTAEGLREWAEDPGASLRVDEHDGLGHAFPADFRSWFESILADATTAFGSLA